MVDSIFHDFKRIQKSEDSVVHPEKQEDAEHDARGTFSLIHDMKSCRVKNLEVDSSRICLKEANFHIVTGKSDHFEFCDSHLVQNVGRLHINLKRLFLDKWKRFSVDQFVLQAESNKWKTTV